MTSDKVASLDAFRKDPEGFKRAERAKRKTELLERLSIEKVGFSAAEESIKEYTRQLTELQSADAQVVDVTRATQIAYLESTIRSFERERDSFKKAIDTIETELAEIEQAT